ncbi:tripartite motif-containing protein 16-like, partial [Clarias magur]
VCSCRKMAEANISVDHNQFLCPVCLDLLKVPVTLPCGHSFCKVCINDCWDQEDHKGVYSCPQCKATSNPRPVLRRNKVLAEVMEKLMETESFAPSPPPAFADVECDYCDGTRLKAVKSCLTCRASFCKIHLKPHLDRPAFRTHTIINATTKLQEKICSQHNKPMEIYCCTDQTCICFLCTLDRHKGHDIVTAAAERAEKQSELKEEQMKSQQRIQEKQKKVQELRQAVNTIKLIVQTAVKDSERIFTEMISSIEKQRSEVTALIRARGKAEVSRAEQLLKQLEQEVEDLQRSDNELKQLLQTNDHISFLKVLASRRRSSTDGTTDTRTSSVPVNQHLSFDGLRKCLSDVKKRLEEFCEEEFNKIPPHVKDIPEPTNREEFLK